MGQAVQNRERLFAPPFRSGRRMAERVMTFAPATDAEALKLLRASFPQCPLSMRVAALDFLMRRQRAARLRPVLQPEISLPHAVVGRAAPRRCRTA